MERIITPERSEIFSEGKVFLVSESIVLRNIFVVITPEVRSTITFDGNLRDEDDKEFIIMDPTEKDIKKLIDKEFTIELNNGPTLQGCTIRKHQPSHSEQINGVYTNLI